MYNSQSGGVTGRESGSNSSSPVNAEEKGYSFKRGSPKMGVQMGESGYIVGAVTSSKL
jgi:hypothetical protein